MFGMRKPARVSGWRRIFFFFLSSVGSEDAGGMLFGVCRQCIGTMWQPRIVFFNSNNLGFIFNCNASQDIFLCKSCFAELSTYLEMLGKGSNWYKTINIL